MRQGTPSTRALQACLRRGPRATGGRRLWTTLGVKGHRPLVGDRDGHDVLDLFFSQACLLHWVLPLACQHSSMLSMMLPVESPYRVE